MTMPLRIARAEADYGRLDAETASLIKGMLVRGDKQSDIAACFQINAGSRRRDQYRATLYSHYANAG